MDNLIEYFDKFNRKERFLLLGYALGNHDFKISDDFRIKLEKALHLEIPKNSFNAMDYHLDWIFACIYLAYGSNLLDKPFRNNNNVIKGTQEDVDFLVVYPHENKYHIIMIEAKGATGWKNEQINSKASRLKEIFGDDGTTYHSIIPHFVFTSPNRPHGLNTESYPKWMKPEGDINWIEMPIPTKLKVTKCDLKGNENRSGGFWKVDEV